MLSVSFFVSAFVALGPADEGINRHLFPLKSNSIVMVNMDAVNKTGLFTEDIQRGFNEVVRNNDQIKKISQYLRFDPVKDLHAFTICGTGEGGRRGQRGEGLIIINGNFDYDKLSQVLNELAQAGDLTVHKHNDLPVYYNHKSRDAAYFALIDNKTLAITGNKQMMHDAIQGVTDLREPTGDVFQRLKWRADEDSSPAFSLVGLFPKTAKEQMARNPMFAGFANNMVAYNIQFTFGNPSKFVAKIAMTTVDSAEDAAEALSNMIELAKFGLSASQEQKNLLEMLNKLKIDTDNKDLLLEVDISEELMKSMILQSRRDRERFEERAKKRRLEREKRGVKEKADEKTRRPVEVKIKLP